MKRRTFTLIELLAAMAILVVLAGMTLGLVKYASSRQLESATRAKMLALQVALDKYKNDFGTYPIFDDKLYFSDEHGDLKKAWEKFIKGKYLEGDYTGANASYADGGGEVFRYKCPGAHNKTGYDLWAIGDDESWGTDDDICNWKQN